MKTSDLATAEALYTRATHAGVEYQRLKGLSDTLRHMGLVRTFEALHNKKRGGGTALAQLLRQELGLPNNARQATEVLETMSRPELFALHRCAHALAEALHLIATMHKRNA